MIVASLYHHIFFLTLSLAWLNGRAFAAWLGLPAPSSHCNREFCGLSGWSRQVDAENFFVQDCGKCSTKDRTLDLSSPREWLEFWEAKYNRPGAYTVLRCDYLAGREAKEDSNPWVVWGDEFHRERLQKSMRRILDCNEDDLKRLTEASDKAMEVLLSDASAMMKEVKHEETQHEPTLTTFMVTILWQLRDDKSDSRMELVSLVEGHITRLPTGPIVPHLEPVSAVLALSTRDKNHQWPNRKELHPEAKLSSWCCQRKPLEETLKQPGISEVLLVKEDNIGEGHETEILEGLISNAFFVYKGGVLRTAQSGVLHGFARYLVLRYALECGLKIDTQNPVLMKDANQWEEVFITSSIRIITPVNKLLIPNYQSSVAKAFDLETLWVQDSSAKQEPYSQRLLHRIVGDQVKK